MQPTCVYEHATEKGGQCCFMLSAHCVLNRAELHSASARCNTDCNGRDLVHFVPKFVAVKLGRPPVQHLRQTGTQPKWLPYF